MTTWVGVTPAACGISSICGTASVLHSPDPTYLWLYGGNRLAANVDRTKLSNLKARPVPLDVTLNNRTLCVPMYDFFFSLWIMLAYFKCTGPMVKENQCTTTNTNI